VNESTDQITKPHEMRINNKARRPARGSHMILLLILIIGYVAFGIGLLWLSVRLTRSIPSLVGRAAIHGAVFALWFSPGMFAGNGGRIPGPLWLALLTHKSAFSLYVSGRTFVFVWAFAFVVAFCSQRSPTL
jgi:hypothetical protein